MLTLNAKFFTPGCECEEPKEVTLAELRAYYLEEARLASIAAQCESFCWDARCMYAKIAKRNMDKAKECLTLM